MLHTIACTNRHASRHNPSLYLNCLTVYTLYAHYHCLPVPLPFPLASPPPTCPAVSLFLYLATCLVSSLLLWLSPYSLATSIP